MWPVLWGLMQAVKMIMKPEFSKLMFGMWLVIDGYVHAIKLIYCWILWDCVLDVACDAWFE